MGISLTESAATRVKTFLAARGHGIGLRLGVRKTGCSGFAYVINYADGPRTRRRAVRGPRRAGVRGRGEPRADRRNHRGLREAGPQRGLPLQKPERQGRMRLRRELLGLSRRQALHAGARHCRPVAGKKSLSHGHFRLTANCRRRRTQGKLRRACGKAAPTCRLAYLPLSHSKGPREWRSSAPCPSSSPTASAAITSARSAPLREGRPVDHRRAHAAAVATRGRRVLRGASRAAVLPRPGALHELRSGLVTGARGRGRDRAQPRHHGCDRSASKAAAGTIRADLASSIEQNVVHGSDAPQTAAREIAYFFSTTELHARA